MYVNYDNHETGLGKCESNWMTGSMTGGLRKLTTDEYRVLTGKTSVDRSRISVVGKDSPIRWKWGWTLSGVG